MPEISYRGWDSLDITNDSDAEDLASYQMALVGAAMDMGAVTQNGQARAPMAVRTARHGIGDYWAGNPDYRLSTVAGVDLGDMLTPTALTRAVGECINQHVLPIVLGGDDSISYFASGGVNMCHSPWTLVHFDAHADYDVVDANGVDHGSWVTGALTTYGISQVIGCGYRTPARRPLSSQHKVVNVAEMAGMMKYRKFSNEPIHIVVDLDCIDPSEAPGVAVPEAGGLRAIQVAQLLRSMVMNLNVVAISLTEMVPDLDVRNLTAGVVNYLIDNIRLGLIDKAAAELGKLASGPAAT